MKNCEACADKGYLLVSIDGYAPPAETGMVFLQRCDACDLFESDFVAAKYYPGAILGVVVRKKE